MKKDPLEDSKPRPSDSTHNAVTTIPTLSPGLRAFIIKQEIYLKKIFSGIQMRTYILSPVAIGRCFYA